METYIVRQPIINSDQKVEAYELVYYQDSSSLYNQKDAKAANAIVSFFNQIDSTTFLSEKDAFITFTPNLLMQNVPRIFDQKKLVIQIEENVLVNPVAKMILQRYKGQGYRIAMIGFEFNSRFLGILPFVDIMKVDFSTHNDESIQTCLSIARKFEKKTSAYNVNTPEDRERALKFGFDYIQGQSVAEMVKTKIHKMEHLQSNFFRLMVAISRENPEFDEISYLVSLDVTLTFSLIKMVNSSYFALPNRVKDVKQALAVLGLSQLRQWIYLLSFTPDGGVSDELIKLSFLRAIFCQELSQFAADFPISRSEAYMLGMFSTLGVLLEVPLEDALKELPISDLIKQGLISGEGKCGEMLSLCVAYEKAQWSKMSKYADSLGVPANIIAQKYLEAAEYVGGIWEELMKSFFEGDA